jgi:hypothetical protein
MCLGLISYFVKVIDIFLSAQLCKYICKKTCLSINMLIFIKIYNVSRGSYQIIAYCSHNHTDHSAYAINLKIRYIPIIY